MKKFSIVILFIFILLSCGQDKRYLDLTFVFDHPVENNYPEVVPNMLLPFSSTECDKLFAFKPIHFIRIDISNKTVKSKFWDNLKARTDVESMDSLALAEWLKSEFGGKPISVLTKKAGNPDKQRIEQYIAKQKKKGNIVWIYSEEYMDESYDSIPVFSEISDIRKRLRNIACNLNDKKIFLFINPKFLGSSPSPPPPPPSPGPTTKITTSTYKYSGEIKDNQPHGTGTMVFLKDGFAPVPKHSPKQIPVKKGQKLTGRFLHGKFVAGSLLDEHGNKIKSIYIGR